MDELMFWRLVEASKTECTPELSNQPELLQHKLEQLPPEEIRDFESIFRQLYIQAYRRDLWAAAFIIEGGCSDDGFTNFRGGLIGLGREAYYAALANPEGVTEGLAVAGAASGAGTGTCGRPEATGQAWLLYGMRSRSCESQDDPVKLR